MKEAKIKYRESLGNPVGAEEKDLLQTLRYEIFRLYSY